MCLDNNKSGRTLVTLISGTINLLPKTCHRSTGFANIGNGQKKLFFSLLLFFAVRRPPSPVHGPHLPFARS